MPKRLTIFFLSLLLFFLCLSSNTLAQVAWEETQPSGNSDRSWLTASMSDDGRVVLVGAEFIGGRLHLSTDGGDTWAETQPAGNVDKGWAVSSISSNGEIMLVGVGEFDSGRLYISTNGGDTWVETQPAGNTNINWTAASMSSDGEIILVGATVGRLYISTNGGDTWTETRPVGDVSRFWKTISMSSDGQVILAAAAGARLYISTNGGGTWAETQPAGNVDRTWGGSAMNADGEIILVGVGGNGGTGRLYLSTDGGDTWAETQPAGNVNGSWRPLSMSSDGETLMAGSNGGRLYLSTDGGDAWAETQPIGSNNTNWSATSMSGSGQALLAMDGFLAGDGRIYFSSDSVSPVHSLVSSSNVDEDSVQITWTTDENSSTKVNFGLTNGYGSSTAEADTSTRVTSHSAIIASLISCTEYHYQTSSTDAWSNTSTGADGTFTTTGCSGDIVSTEKETITTAGGGSLSEGSLVLTAPMGFTGAATSVVFQAHELDSDDFFTAVASPTGQTAVSDTAFNLRAFTDATTTLSSFDQPITIEITYDPVNITGLDESLLTIYRHDGLAWHALDSCSVNTGTSTVSCTTTEFSDFALFGSPPVVVASGSSSGSTLQSRINNLLASGAFEKADILITQKLSIITPTPVEQLSNTEDIPTQIIRDLKSGMRGSDVVLLQRILILQGLGASAKTLEQVGPTGYFGPLTRAALAEYQSHYGIKPALGYFGQITRAQMKATNISGVWW